MTKKIPLIISTLFLLFSCSEKPRDGKKLPADSAASIKTENVPQSDTLGFAGQWKSSYTEYADKFSVDLEIKKSGTGSCPEYSCTWMVQNQYGGDRKTYTWCAKYEHAYSVLSGTGNMGVDNTDITIYKNYENGLSLDVSIRFPGRTQPWDVHFTHK